MSSKNTSTVHISRERKLFPARSDGVPPGWGPLFTQWPLGQFFVGRGPKKYRFQITQLLLPLDLYPRARRVCVYTEDVCI